ncbi:MAG: glycine cleavage T C-terminal barrel domain-containing protein [Polyangiaceae bacterium]
METKTQVEAARHTLLAIPHVDIATLAVSGQDRIAWVNGLFTCDLLKRPAGHAVYGLAVARNGRVLSDATILDDDGSARLLVAVPSTVAAPLREHLEHYLVMEDAEIAVQTDGFSAWAVHGPRAVEAVEAARGAGAVAATIDRTGLGGAFVLAPVERATQVREAIERSVRERNGCIGNDLGWEALRLERAVPRFGPDFDDKAYPQEASLEKSAVSFEKGCYLGQEVVCMLEMRGHVKRRLVSLVLESAEPPARGVVVTDEGGAAVGEVTSASPSPTLGGAVAFAMLKRAWTEPGKRLLVEGARAEVVQRPA